jgi:carboxymethylenebutenolidase
MTIFAIPSPDETLFYGERGAPLVILMHDPYGRLPWLESLASSLVREGFQVAVPDFYHGFATDSAVHAQELLARCTLPLCLELIDQTVDEARAGGTTRIGSVGFSYGGRLALGHAQGGGVDAVVAYYASLLERYHTLIPCPVLLQNAEVDQFEAERSADSFFERLRVHGTPTTRFGYLDTEHHFANASIPATYRQQAAALAFARTSAFLSQHLLDY